MDVAGAAFAVVGLGHEGHRLTLLVRDLLGAEFVDDVVVARGEHVGVAEADLELTEVAFALRAFGVEASAVHLIAQASQVAFDLAGAEERVVDVVGAGGFEVPVVVAHRLAVAGVVEGEFEFCGADGCVAERREALQLSLEHLSW